MNYFSYNPRVVKTLRGIWGNFHLRKWSILLKLWSCSKMFSKESLQFLWVARRKWKRFLRVQAELPQLSFSTLAQNTFLEIKIIDIPRKLHIGTINDTFYNFSVDLYHLVLLFYIFGFSRSILIIACFPFFLCRIDRRIYIKYEWRIITHLYYA